MQTRTSLYHWLYRQEKAGYAEIRMGTDTMNSRLSTVEEQTVRRRMRSNQGFTLVELMGVITVMAALMGIILAATASINRRSAQAQCASQMEQIAKLLENYRAVKGYYPASNANYDNIHDVINRIKADPAFSQTEAGVDYSKLSRDPWGYYYKYACKHAGGNRDVIKVSGKYQYHLGSRGPNGKWGTGKRDEDKEKNFGEGDDITNLNGGMR